MVYAAKHCKIQSKPRYQYGVGIMHCKIQYLSRYQTQYCQIQFQSRNQDCVGSIASQNTVLHEISRLCKRHSIAKYSFSRDIKMM